MFVWGRPNKASSLQSKDGVEVFDGCVEGRVVGPTLEEKNNKNMDTYLQETHGAHPKYQPHGATLFPSNLQSMLLGKYRRD